MEQVLNVLENWLTSTSQVHLWALEAHVGYRLHDISQKRIGIFPSTAHVL